MKRLILLLFALLPALAWAGGLKVEKEQRATAKPGWSELRGDRGEKVKKFDTGQLTASGHKIRVARIFQSPVHELDSVAGWVEPEVTVKDTSGAFNIVARSRGWTAFGDTLTGRMRWEQKGGWVEMIPRFSLDSVAMKWIVDEHGIKEYVTVSDTNIRSLRWALSYSTVMIGEGGKGKGRVEKLNKLVAEIDELTAVDGLGKGVSLNIVVTDTSYTVSIPAGTIYDVVIDPTMRDSAARTADTTAGVWVTGGSSQAVWDEMRNSPTAETVAISGGTKAAMDGGSEMKIHRIFSYIDLVPLTTAVSIDSARIHFYWKQYSVQVDTVRMIQATTTGRHIHLADYNNFTGWTADSTAWTVVDYASAMYVNTPSNDFAWNSTKFTAAGVAALDSLMGDTLRYALLEDGDINDLLPDGITNRYIYEQRMGATYTDIYYVEGSQPGVTYTNQDSVKYRVPLFAQVDSTGGLATTARGFRYYVLGADSAAMMITITDSVSNLASVDFVALSDSLAAVDTSIVVQAWATNPKGTSYSPWVTISTAVSSGWVLRVVGRLVNTAR